jgi:hypothetical protein
MTQQTLHEPDIHSRFEQLRRGGMSQHVWSDPPADAAAVRKGPEDSSEPMSRRRAPSIKQ